MALVTKKFSCYSLTHLFTLAKLLKNTFQNLDITNHSKADIQMLIAHYTTLSASPHPPNNRRMIISQACFMQSLLQNTCKSH